MPPLLGARDRCHEINHAGNQVPICEQASSDSCGQICGDGLEACVPSNASNGLTLVKVFE